jgi:signal transduction histidine kinase/ActR/RegA family two-component response regulator
MLSYLEGYDAGVYVAAETVSAAGVPSERVIRERRSLVLLSSDDPAGAGSHLMGTGRRSESSIRAPILSGEEVMGVIAVHSYTPGLYSNQDVEVLEAIASLAATAIENIRLAAERGRAEHALQAAYADLERRVAERTAELAQANEALIVTKDEAEQAREAAEEANRAKSEFLSRMSHELRTPMNSILGFGQLLGRQGLVAEQRKSVDHILKAGQHLLNLINEVLDLARIESNRQQLTPEPVHLDSALREAINLIRPLATQTGCVIADDVAVDAAIDDALWVRADRQRLAQVLLNLLSNAVKYNRPGGRVWLTCELLPAEENRVRVGVHDTGRGIKQDRMGELFLPFSRLGAEGTGVEGTGLGLALSKRLIEAMGGAIHAESAFGAGSSFWIELHLERGTAIPDTDPAGAAVLEATTAVATRVLCVEDNEANLTLVEAILALRPNVTMIPALQGGMGLDLARQHQPDLILLDVNLPDMPGEEVLRRLRADTRTRAIPVIVISADATPESIRRHMDAGARGYITKPIDVEVIIRTLDEMIAEQTDAARGDQRAR